MAAFTPTTAIVVSTPSSAPIAVHDEHNNGDSCSLSDDEDEVAESAPSSLKGTLNKWTNYIHGWQSRYFLLRDGTLAYYKSEHDRAFGCRGAIAIARAIIQPHDFDECRFDISVNDCVWYLRAESCEDKQRWVEALEAYKTESGYGSQNDLRRHGSVVSLTSNKSLTSQSSFKKGRGLREKLAELETFRDIVCRQIDTLQAHFDSCASAAATTTAAEERTDVGDVDSSDTDMSEFATPVTRKDSPRDCDRVSSARNVNALDFKGEALTFKATTAGILSTIQHCVDLIQQREEVWKRRLDKEVEKRKKSEEMYRQTYAELQKAQRQQKSVVFGGPDYEEGPHSALNEEEWHDAVDAALEKQDIEERRVQRLLSKSPSTPAVRLYDKVSLNKTHPLFDEIEHLTMEQIRYAKAGVEEGVWQLFAEDGEMKMYKREVEIDGLVCDPLKAVHSVKHVTAREYLHYFFEPEYKTDWDTTLDDVKVLERLSDDTIIFHQVHKRVWPASQRESLFWSHFRRVQSMADPNASDLYAVCNHDTQHKDAALNSKNVRVGMTVAMVCQTVVDPPKPGVAITRDDIMCKIIYVAQVNPGGWAPSSVLRAVYKREYPRFLKRFTAYVLSKVEGTPIRF